MIMVTAPMKAGYNEGEDGSRAFSGLPNEMSHI